MSGLFKITVPSLNRPVGTKVGQITPSLHSLVSRKSLYRNATDDCINDDFYAYKDKQKPFLPLQQQDLPCTKSAGICKLCCVNDTVVCGAVSYGMGFEGKRRGGGGGGGVQELLMGRERERETDRQTETEKN